MKQELRIKYRIKDKEFIEVKEIDEIIEILNNLYLRNEDYKVIFIKDEEDCQVGQKFGEPLGIPL